MKMIRNFWWGDEPDHRKIHYWIAWEKMMMPKHMGGMGFRDMKLFNQGAVGKTSLEAGGTPQEPVCSCI